MNEQSIASISDSILSSVKKLVGVSEDDTSFDVDISLNINAALATLYQIGVLQRPYTVTSKDDTYNDAMPGLSEDIVNEVKMYLSYKTRIGFDTSGMTSSVIEVIKEMIRESEWRLTTSVNPPGTYD